MESLTWENGAAPNLRARVLAHLRETYTTRNAAGNAIIVPDEWVLPSVKLLLAVRFRRTVAGTLQSLPRQYTHEVDVAWIDHTNVDVPQVVIQMLESRAPGQAVRYDLLSVRLSMPGGLGAALQPATNADKVPLLMELIDASGATLFDKAPADVASAIGKTDAVRSLRPSDYEGLPTAVIAGLTNGVNRWANDGREWRDRPDKLLAIAAVPVAVLRAMDSDDSPCEPIARLYQYRVAGQDEEMVTYQGSQESAAFPDPNAKGNLTVKIPQYGALTQIAITSKNPTGTTHVANHPDESKRSSEFQLSAIQAVGSKWSAIAEVELLSDSFTLYAPKSSISPFESGVVAATMANILVLLMKNVMPNVGGSRSVSWAELILVRWYSTLKATEIVPSVVLDEFMARLIGKWAYHLMSKGLTWESNKSDRTNVTFWYDWIFGVYVQPTAEIQSLLVGIRHKPKPDTPEQVSFSKRHAKQARDNVFPRAYTQLVNAIGLHLLPWYGDFGETRITEPPKNKR